MAFEYTFGLEGGVAAWVSLKMPPSDVCSALSECVCVCVYDLFTSEVLDSGAVIEVYRVYSVCVCMNRCCGSPFIHGDVKRGRSYYALR